MTTVLVLSNHTDVLETALQAAGHEVIAVMTRHAHQLRDRSGHRPSCRTLTVDTWQAYDDLARITRDLRGSVDRVATTWEGAVVAAGFLRDLLDLPGMTLHTALGVTDKAVMKWRLHDAELPVARFRYVRTPSDVYEAAHHVGWPMVIKPLNGFGSFNTFTVDTAADLRAGESHMFHQPPGSSPFFHAEPAYRALTAQPGFIVEQDLQPVTEYHVDQLWDDGEPLYTTVGRYNTPPLQGIGIGCPLGSVLLPSDDPTGERLAELACDAVYALRATDGFTHTEILQDRHGRRYIGEVAARPGGGGIQRLLHHAYGLDIPSLLAAHAAGDRLTTIARVEPRSGVYGWIGPTAPEGRIREIATPAAIMRHPAVLEATVTAKPGDPAGPAATTLWAGAVGHAFLHATTVQDVLALMPEVADAYRIVVDQTAAVGA